MAAVDRDGIQEFRTFAGKSVCVNYYKEIREYWEGLNRASFRSYMKPLHFCRQGPRGVRPLPPPETS